MAGLALGCTIARHTKWDRKSYYYPDSRRTTRSASTTCPLCYDGRSTSRATTGRRRRSASAGPHLEEDAGKLLHEAPGGFAIDHSIVDLNRAGTPLLEIVTEPDLATPHEVTTFAQELQRLVQFLGVSEGQMQMGHMRFEPNINVHITDATARAQDRHHRDQEPQQLQRAGARDRVRGATPDRPVGGNRTPRPQEHLRLGRIDESTFHQRDKEDAHDYRYFPDPDLVPVEVSDDWLAELKAQVGELPAARRRRYVDALGLPPPTPRPSPATARPAIFTSARSPPAARPSGCRTSCSRTAGG
jgi:aspartyl-tRNA(Asn)/glutamyl-tRNA(Gln) amidotransferase subunit B